MLFVHLSLSGQGHFGFKSLSWLPELLIVMPVCRSQARELVWTVQLGLLMEICASQRGRAVSEIAKFFLDLHYCQNGIAVNSCAILNTGGYNVVLRKISCV